MTQKEYNPTKVSAIVRLDLDTFILSGPESTDHTCLYDQFYVTGGSVPVPTVCGTNSGAHSKSVDRHGGTGIS